MIDHVHNTAELPPNADDCEARLCMSILVDPAALDEAIASGIRPDHFRQELHRNIVQTALQLQERGVTSADATLIHRESAGRINSADLVTLMDTTSEAGDIGEHVRWIIAAAQRRGLAYAYRDGLRLIREDRTPDEIAAAVTSQTDAVFDAGSDGPEHIADVLLRMQDRAEQQAEPGLMTGVWQLDHLLSGLRPGHLVVLAARPGHGKTALAASIALRAAQAGDAALFVSLEMSSDELAVRMLSLASGLDHSRIRDGRLDEMDQERLAEAQNELANAPLRILDRTPLRISDIAAATRLAVRRDKLRLLIIDYIQLIEPADRKVIREQQVAEMSRSLKTLAKSCGIPVLCLAQLNRAIEGREDKRPRLSDLRESGAIEQDADVVAFLHRAGIADPDADQTAATLFVAKNRHGRTGDCQLQWIGSRMEYRSPEVPV